MPGKAADLSAKGFFVDVKAADLDMSTSPRPSGNEDICWVSDRRPLESTCKITQIVSEKQKRIRYKLKSKERNENRSDKF